MRFIFKSPIQFANPEVYNSILRHPDTRIINYDVIRFSIGPFIFSYLVSPELINESINLLEKDEYVYTLFEPWLGNSILLSKGQLWKRNRKLLTGMFHFKSLRNYTSIQNNSCEKFIQTLIENSYTSEYVDFCGKAKKFALEMILNIICSQNLSLINEMTPRESKFIKNIELQAELIFKRFDSSVIYIISDYLYSLSKNGRIFLQCCRESRMYIQSLLQKRRQDKLLTNQPDYNDMLELVTQCRDKHGNGLSDKEIIDELSTFVFAGLDTTSSLSASVMYCLATHPNLQQKCRNEVNAVLGGRDYIEYEDHAKLHYVTQFIKETLRLYSPVFDVIREANQPITIGDYFFPYKSKIAICLQGVHLNPKYWIDPFIFNPERFSSENAKNIHPYAFIPFSAGNRNCIGQILAINSIRMFVVHVVRTMSVSIKPGYEYKLKYSFNLWPEHGLPILITKIN